MATELFANPPSPGGPNPWVLATLTTAINTTPSPGTTETWPVSNNAPTALTSSSAAQFRVVIDSEVMIVTASSTGVSPWTFQRGAESTTVATHSTGSAIYHVLTAGALGNITATGGGGGGAGSLLATNNLSDLVSAVTARANLGLGSAATQGSSAFDAAGAAATAQSASLQKTSNLSDVASVSTARTNLGLGTAATQASSAFDSAGAAATAQAASAMNLVPTGVKSTAYAAAAGDFVPCDISSTSFAITLPNAPADKTRIGIKVIAVDAGHADTLTVAVSGVDVFNKASGSTSLTLTALFQGIVVQYASSTHIWYVQSLDAPLGQPLGAAVLGTDGRVGGPGGSPVTGGGGGGSGLPANVLAKTANYTALVGDFIDADASGGTFTITLPSAPAVGSLVTVKKVDTSATAVAVVAQGSSPAWSIDGDTAGASITSPQFGAVFEYVGSNAWKITAVTSSGGSNGTSGNTVWNGTTAPASGLGANGDFYINTSTWNIFGPKAGGTWPSGVSLVGPQGSPGAISQIQVGGTNQTVEGKVNLIAGTNVTLTPADDPANGRTNVTVASTASGGGSVAGQIYQYRGGGLWYTNPLYYGVVPVTGLNPVNGRLYFMPFLMGAGTPTFDQIGFQVNSSGTSGTINIGIYTDNGAYPGSLVTSGSAAQPGGAGVFAATLSSAWTPSAGLYWIALLELGSTVDVNLYQYSGTFGAVLPMQNASFTSGAAKSLSLMVTGQASLPAGPVGAGITPTSTAPALMYHSV